MTALAINLSADDFETPCYGQSALFDSTYRLDHQAAKLICEGTRDTPGCPYRIACLRLLEQTKKAAGTVEAGPVGTWGGVLVGVPGSPGRPRKIKAAW